jgi:two-component system OmpR family sensor kinase
VPLPAPAQRWVDAARTRAAGVPLRVRLVAILLALALAALAITGAAAVALLRGELVDRIDTQIVAVATRALATGRPVGPPDPSASQLATKQYVAVRTDSGLTQTYGPSLDEAVPPDLDALTPERVTALGGEPFTLQAERGEGQWRAVARRVTLIDGRSASLVVAQSLGDVQKTVRAMAVILVGVGLGALLLLSLLGGVVVRRALRPLTEVESVASAIADGDLTRRVPAHPSSTEVGRLSASLNAMLAQIEQAFAVREASEERMRRFVSDASHELRTPLATVRGYAELYRQGAVTDPEDVTTAMRRIETEATRMGGLVEDLLTLARVDEQRAQGQGPLMGPVDLTVLAADAVQDARALEPGREVTLSGSLGPLQPAVVLGDEPRLRQVVTNLVANALRHTPPGTPVQLRVGVEEGTGVLWVSDRGPGIAPEHARQVFERFFRSDVSRQRGHGGGSGLGLAIVAAIVAAHHGQVGVSQTPGGGATFVVRLPLAAVAERDIALDEPADGQDQPADVGAPALTGSSQAHPRA